MIYLILSILCSAAIFIIFKSFERFKVNTFTAIVVNYFIAGVTGFATLGEAPSFEKVTTSPWFINSLILGVVFISLFNIMAITAQKLGASVASIANKMALIIPVSFAIIYYNDVVNATKIAGIILALIRQKTFSNTSYTVFRVGLYRHLSKIQPTSLFKCNYVRRKIISCNDFFNGLYHRNCWNEPRQVEKRF